MIPFSKPQKSRVLPPSLHDIEKTAWEAFGLLNGMSRQFSRSDQTHYTKQSMPKTLNTNRGAFTLVEIMIVVAIIALLAAIAVPNFLRSRKCTQATQVLEDLRMLDQALELYAIETHKKTGDTAGWSDLVKYIKPGTRLYLSNGLDMHGHEYAYFFGGVVVDTPGQIRVCSLTYANLSDVAPLDFWSPYGVEGM